MDTSLASLVPLQPQGTWLPLFCVHAIGGNVLSLRDLAQHLGPEQPFYALQSQGLNGQEKLPTSVAETAAYYIQEISTIQPNGPYFLAGQSSGGVIAFEIACQLSQAGHKVALLALIDTYPPQAIASKATSFKDKLKFHRQAIQHFGPQYILEQSQARFRREGNGWNAVH